MHKLAREIVSTNIYPETCDMLGHRAVELAHTANIPLTDAIVKVAASVQGLNNQHINNICYVANNEYFRKVAAARKQAGLNLVFEYPLAEPSEVSKQINQEAAPKVSHVLHDPEYMAPPQQSVEKRAYAADYNPFDPQGRGPSKAELESQRQRQVKEAMADLDELYETTERAVDLADRQLEYARVKAGEAKRTFIDLFKQAAVSGISQAAILDLISRHPEADENFVEHAFTKAAMFLAHNEPYLFRSHSKTLDEKVAGVADFDHPLYAAFDEWYHTKEAKRKLEKVLKVAQADFKEISGTKANLRQKFATIRLSR